MIGNGHLELGHYPQAFAAFDRMMQLRPSAAAYARVAYARELLGDLNGAVVSMKLAAAATAADDPEALAWTRAQLGELYLQLGRLHDAKVEFSAAVAYWRRDGLSYRRFIIQPASLAIALTGIYWTLQRAFF